MKECSPALKAAIGDYRLLLDRGYPVTATIKLVGDRYRLDRSERFILFRGVLDEASSAFIRGKILVTLAPESEIGVDGYNVLFTLINYRRGHPHLDAPVSHSGQHRKLWEATCSRFGIPAAAETVQNADLPLQDFTGTAVASSDSKIALKSRAPIFDLARHILEREYRRGFIDLGALFENK